MDTSLLRDHLASYVFPTSQHQIVDDMVLGISLGAHAAWQCLLKDVRLSTLISIIGCPDFTRLMKDRAAKSHLKSWEDTSPPGSGFLGSVDFPQDLVEAVMTADPAASILRSATLDEDGGFLQQPSAAETCRINSAMKRLTSKSVLNMSGGADKLVPYTCSQPFLKFLEKAKGSSHDVHAPFDIVDKVFDGVGHECTTPMMDEAESFIEQKLIKLNPLFSAEGSSGMRKGSSL